MSERAPDPQGGNVSEEVSAEVFASARTAPGPGLPPEEETSADAAVLRMMADVRGVGVSDLLDLTARRYERLLQDPEDVEHAAGYAYMAERARALADLFRDVSDPTACVLDGRASGVDFVRGLRVLAARHPVPEGRELAAAFANCCCHVLSERIGGIPVDQDPVLETPDGTARTLLIWYQQVMRASRAAHQIAASGGRVQSAGGLALIGKGAQVRARLVVDLQLQGMGELGVLIDHVGLPLNAPSPADVGGPAVRGRAST